MRLLITAVLCAALGWSAFWWIGSRSADRDVTTWLSARHDSGWVANFADVSTRGFPNRFDTTITDLELADPDTGLAWTAPFFQIFRLSYQPNHLIAIWPNAQTLATPNQQIAIETESARASLVFDTGQDWTLERGNFTASDIELTSNAGWRAEIADLRLATRPSERIDGAIDVGFETRNLRPANTALAKLAEMGFVPGILDSLKVDASATFDAPWDRHAIEVARPNMTALDLHLMQMRWGQLDLWMAGVLTFDAQGRASGSLTVKAKNWRDMLQLLTATGWLPEAAIGPMETGLGLLATLSGSKETLDAPLTFTNGAMSFGPIPLGTLPSLKIR